MAPSNANTSLLNASPKIINGLRIGVAKNRLITSVCLKLKKNKCCSEYTGA